MPVKVYKINDKFSITLMQKDLRDHFELQYVAQELVQNILDEKEYGRIYIQGLNKIHIDIYANSEKIERLKRSLKEAQGKKEKHEEGPICSSKGNSKQRGRGLISILKIGWELNILDKTDGVTLTARKV